jgi:hypothetical protein
MRWLRLAFTVALTCVSIPAFAAEPVVLVVDDDAAPGGDGSARLPFHDVRDAVAAAAAASGPVIIKVRPGEYALAQPLIVERSFIELRGSTELVEDDDGLPTGEAVPGTETRILAANPGVPQSLFVVGRPDVGPLLSDVTIRGFIFSGGTGGTEVLLDRVQNFEVRGNVFTAPSLAGLASVASSGRAIGNYATGVGVGLGANGGYAESPSNVVITSNRCVHNNNGGVALVGASSNIPELGDELTAIVRSNDLSENTTRPMFSFGLRIAAPGQPTIGTQSSARVHAVVEGNRIVGNALGVTIDAGFPYRLLNGVCDPRTFSGEVDATFIGNTLTGSVLTQALVTFTRNQAALDQALLPQWQYLHEATFTIDDRDGTLASAWIDHPPTDPFLGPCLYDATRELLGNTLSYNGVVVPNGRNF